MNSAQVNLVHSLGDLQTVHLVIDSWQEFLTKYFPSDAEDTNCLVYRLLKATYHVKILLKIAFEKKSSTTKTFLSRCSS